MLRIMGVIFLPVAGLLGKISNMFSSSKNGFLVIRPSKRAMLFSQGIEKAEDVFNLEGIRVTGHGWKTGRHVSSVTLGNGKNEARAFLKKEHNRGWAKTILAHSAGVLHEARILKALEHEGIPAPLWVAVGKTCLGHSFLLVEEIPDTVNLKTYFAEQRSRNQRKEVLRRLAWVLARMHTLGFSHVDLYSKHVLVNPETRMVYLLDWQRSFRMRDLPWNLRSGNLARLHATLDESILRPREKLAFLTSYLEATAHFSQGNSNLPLFHLLALDIDREAIRLLSYRHVREKRNTQVALQPQNWIFLEKQNLFVTSICSEDEKLHLDQLLLEAKKLQVSGKVVLRKTMPCGDSELRLQYRNISWFESLFFSYFKSRKAKAPEYSHAAILYKIQRHGVCTGKILALGIRKKNFFSQESFLLTREPAKTLPLYEWFQQGTSAEILGRQQMVFEAMGRMLAKVHSSGCYLKGKKTLFLRVAESSDLQVYLDAANCLEEAPVANPKWASIDMAKMKQVLRSLGAQQQGIVCFRKAYSDEIGHDHQMKNSTSQIGTGVLAMDVNSGGTKLATIRKTNLQINEMNMNEMQNGVAIQVQKDGSYVKFYSSPEWIAHYGEDWTTRVMDIGVTDRFHSKQGRSVGRIILPGKDGKPELCFYLKRHYKLSFWEGLMGWLFPKKASSPALQEFHHLATARQLGLQVPETVAAVEFIGPGARLRSALAVRELDNMIPLHEAIPLASVRQTPQAFRRWKKSLVSEMARMSRILHDRNWFHKDLYLCHFYIDKNDTFRTPNWRDKVVLIDLHRLGSHTWTSQVWKIKDLAQLIYSSEIEGVDDRDRLEFWRCYRDLGPRSALDRILLYVIRIKWGRYRRHNLKKKAA